MAITGPLSVDWIFGWLWQCSWEVMSHPSYILIVCSLRSSWLASDLWQMPAWRKHLLVADTSCQFLLRLLWLIMLIFLVSICVCRNVGIMILIFLSTAVAESYDITSICMMSVSFSFENTQAVWWMWYLYVEKIIFQDSGEIQWSLWRKPLYCCSHSALYWAG